jgi:hypothetical protein
MLWSGTGRLITAVNQRPHYLICILYGLQIFISTPGARKEFRGLGIV